MNENFKPEQEGVDQVYDELEKWLSEDQEALIDDLLEEFYYPNYNNHKKIAKRVVGRTQN